MVKPCFAMRKQKEKRKEGSTAGSYLVFPFTLFATAEGLPSSPEPLSPAPYSEWQKQWPRFTGD